jgi:hypothetical protein
MKFNQPTERRMEKERTMKEHKWTLGGVPVMHWYDPNIRLWTVVIQDAEGNQIGSAEYANEREMIGWHAQCIIDANRSEIYK